MKHDAQNKGLTVCEDYFIRLDEVLMEESIRKYSVTIKMILHLVNTAKKEFEIKETDGEGYMIRCYSGHSY